MNNFLDNSAKRSVLTCNFNQHINVQHPDRIMGEHDLIYIREGSWCIAQDGIEYEVTPGDVILFQGGHHHYGTRPCSGTVKTCFVHFTTTPKDCVAPPKPYNLEYWQFPMVVHCKRNYRIEQFFNSMILSYWSDDLYAKNKALSYLHLLLSEISEVSIAAGKHIPMVEGMKRQIKTTPERFIGIDEFAQEYCCSIRTISSKFKENTGCSLHAWQMRQKCNMAAELMQYDPSLTLKELAANFGFYDEYHFSKSFKKVMGYSPKSYNEKLIKKSRE